MSDFKNRDIILGNDNIKREPIERELSNVYGNSENQCDTESNSQSRENIPQEKEFGHYVLVNIVAGQDRFQERMETITCELNMTLSQKTDSMMSMMYTQINRAITSAIAERVRPEIENKVSSMSSSGNRDTESGLSEGSQEVTECSRPTVLFLLFLI